LDIQTPLRYYSCLVNKFIVSCYYWPAVEGRLRLRSLNIRTNRGSLSDLTKVETSAIERRRAQRLNIGCEAELTANLTILDSDATPSVASLVFLGRTRDLSAGGLAFVLPSLQIDEKFCAETTRVRLRVYLPTGSVNLEVMPVRCEPLNPENVARGYFIAAQILSIDDQRDVYDNYLRSVTRGI
jgi:hypothetical protein